MAEQRGPFEVHELPSGETVAYRDSDHAYFSRVEERGPGKWVGPRDARLPSPSTIAKMLDTNTEPLLRWAAKQTCEGVVRLGHVPDSGAVLWDALTASKLTYSDLREQRAQEGTAVHVRVLEALAGDGPVPSLADVTAEERGYAQGVFRFWHEHEPVPIVSEQVVYSAEHGFAGRFDLLALLDDQRVLIDLKTSKWIGNGAHVQLAGYVGAAAESGFGPIDEALVLQVAADGSYRLHPCGADYEDFLDALAAYRASKRVSKRSRELLKEAA